MKSKKAGVAFSFCLFSFLGQFKFTFLIFLDTSGCVGKFFTSRGEAEKFAGSGEKNQANTSTGMVFMAETKKTLKVSLIIQTC